MAKRGRASARKLTRAQVHLLADEGRKDKEIADVLHFSRPTVEHLRKRCVNGAVEHALNDRSRKSAPRKLSDRDEAMLVALACSAPPRGGPPEQCSCWRIVW